MQEHNVGPTSQAPVNGLLRRLCRRQFRYCLTVFVFLQLFSVSALAQKKVRRPKVIQLEEIRIEGQVQKPNAFYILNRSNLGYEVLDAKTSFIDEIKDSVESHPF